jgi:DNA-binding transcriptional regulator YhcF (GntR family)
VIIRLAGAEPPTAQIRDQIRGLIASGQLAAGERLPSVRQLARDLGVAAGTVAKAYRALEVEGLLVTRTGGGTRVSATATSTPRTVLEAARSLVLASSRAGVDEDDAVRILRAIWPESADL